MFEAVSANVRSCKLSGSKFQTDGLATEKARRRLNILSQCRGTTSSQQLAYHDAMSKTGTQFSDYSLYTV